MIRARRTRINIKKDFEEFLNDYNCTFTTDALDENRGTRYYFDFQGGHFIAIVRANNDGIEVNMPNVASAPVDALELVRQKCNQHNINNMLLKFTYEVDEDENQIDIHLTFFNNAIRPQEFQSELSACFYFQRQWANNFDKALEASQANDRDDLEQDFYQYKRQLFLARQQELRHQLDTPQHREVFKGSKDELTLWQALKVLAQFTGDEQLLFLNVNGNDRHEHIEDADAIGRYDLRAALVQDTGRKAIFKSDYAVIDLHYRLPGDNATSVPRMLTIALTAEGDDGNSLYTRITVSLPPRNRSRVNSINQDDHQPQCISALTALDRTTQLQRQQEFDYMWKDAQLKVQDDERGELTREQLLLCTITDGTTGYSLYWGQKLFYAGRYLEAIAHFENAFYSGRRQFYNMSNQDKSAMLDVAYYLGFCYNELKLYIQAFSYLNLVSEDGNIVHAMEMVNNMANNKDLRIFNYTDGLMKDLQNHWEDKDEEIPPSIRSFANFLRRRRAYAMIDFGKLDDAEKVFTAMLNEPENADYAINELAYIKKLREQQGQENASESTTESSGDAAE